MKRKCNQALQKAAAFLRRHTIIQYLFMAFCTALITEMFNQRSVLQGLLFPLLSPIAFALNTAIVLLILSVSILFKRRYFACVVLLVVPIGLAIANFILVGMRVIPLEFVDFSILRTGIGIIGIYLNTWQLISLGIVVALCIVGLVTLWIKLPKSTTTVKNKLALLAASALFFSGSALAADATHLIPEDVGNVAEAYENYGFIYCFSMSIFDKGVEKPEDYSKAAVEAVLEQCGTATAPKNTPNILFLQLESFFDINAMTNIELSENPVPNFQKLKQNYTSGFLTVPAVGAGTANTEFEVISQMNLDHFGTGEYPFKTVLMNNTCESTATDLKALGYTAHAFHNHTGAFYSRNVVYPNLGFDTFTPLEYMTDVETNPQGFAKDKLLTGQILTAMHSTNTPDYIYTVSVQGHGKYPTSPVDDTQTITVSGLESAEQTCEYEYYVNQIHEMDEFIGELIDALENYGEDVVLVMYGDHLPSLGIAEENLSAGTLYQTEYVVWDNMGLAKKDRDLHAYQLSAYVLEQVGIHSGSITGIHQSMAGTEGYEDALRLMEYDLLYGKHYATGGKALAAADLTFGQRPIQITGLRALENNIVVKGMRFTQWSRVYVNGKKVDTLYLSDTELVIPGNAAKPGDVLTVVQVCDDRTVLGTSERYIF